MKTKITSILGLGAALLAGCLAPATTDTETTDGAIEFSTDGYTCDDPSSETRLRNDCRASCDAERASCEANVGSAYRSYVKRRAAARRAVDWAALDLQIQARVSEVMAYDCGAHAQQVYDLAQSAIDSCDARGLPVAEAIRTVVAVADYGACEVVKPVAAFGVAMSMIGGEVVETLVQLWYEIQDPFQRFARWLEAEGCKNDQYFCADGYWWDSDADGMNDQTGCEGHVREWHVSCDPSPAAPAPVPAY